MEKKFKRLSGICLLIGSVLAALTMIMHPMGGNIEQIVKIKNVLIFSHSTAILCIPFVAFGFWGLSVSLKTESRSSYLAFTIICFGLFAAMVAATLNGLVLPRFASAYLNSSIDYSYLKAIIKYGMFLNTSLSYIFIIAAALSVAIWSAIVIRTMRLTKWLGYYGLLIVALGLSAMILNFNFTSVIGFGIFVFGLVSWKIIAGVLLLIPNKKLTTND